MNVVKEINSINARELEMGVTGSWHDQYKDSAYIFIGGLHKDLTEGDVITIFSQYGEVMDINMPRAPDTGKPKGFAFLMYEDQRSTILAVDNLNGAKVLDRTLRVDHVANYKQKKKDEETGKWVDAEEPSLAAKPKLIHDQESDSEKDSASSSHSIDPEDPMADYLRAKRREEKAKSKSKKKSKKHEGETPEERRARKERKREKRERKEKAMDHDHPRREGGTNPDRHHRRKSRSRSPRPFATSERSERRHDRDHGGRDEADYRRRDRDGDRERR